MGKSLTKKKIEYAPELNTTIHERGTVCIVRSGHE